MTVEYSDWVVEYEWVWLTHEGEGLARGSREHVKAERDRYERECRERGIVPAVTYISLLSQKATREART